MCVHVPKPRSEWVLRHIEVNFHVVGNMGIVRRNDGYSGCLNKHGYYQFKIRNEETGKQETLVAHHIAWFLFYNKWPDKEVDHENGDRTYNGKDNLRAVTHHMNTGNKERLIDLPTGVKYKPNRNYYEAYIHINGKQTYVGGGNTPGKAAIKYQEAYDRLYGKDESDSQG